MRDLILKITPLVAALPLAALGACGGGGGSAPAATPVIVPPAVVFAAPTDGLLTPGSAVQVRLEVAGIDEPLREVQLAVDGVVTEGLLSLVGSALIGQLALEPGPHTLQATFTGDPAVGDQVAVVVPETAPTGDGVDEQNPAGGLASAWSAPLLEVFGDTATGDLGRSLAPLDDVDEDGVQDFAVGQSLSGSGGEVQFRSGRTGAVLFVVSGEVGDRFGAALAEVPDVDGDGFSDLAVGAINAGAAGEGAALLLSGRDGAELWRTAGLDPEDGLGTSVAAIGDVDGDSVADIAVGARLSPKIGQKGGRALVLSGLDGAVIHDVVGEAAFVQVGTDVAAAGDFDGDGRGDFVVGSWGSGDNGPASGAITVFSGADGTALDRIPGPDANDHFGASITLADDLNFDGRADLVVGSPFAKVGPVSAAEVGEVLAFDGATLELLWVQSGDDRGGQFGREVQAVDDVNGDGASDVLVGAPFELDGQGAVYLLSGADGTLLERRIGPPVIGFFGTACARLDDLDRDGRDEWAIGAPGFSSTLFLAGATFIYTAGGLGVVDDGLSVNPLAGLAGDDSGDPEANTWALVATPPVGAGSGTFDDVVLAAGQGTEPYTLKLPPGGRAELEGWSLRVVTATADGLVTSNTWRPRSLQSIGL